jgi:hypothetical protein
MVLFDVELVQMAIIEMVRRLVGLGLHLLTLLSLLRWSHSQLVLPLLIPNLD